MSSKIASPKKGQDVPPKESTTDSPQKTKAQLKAERRELQEKQRAAKLAAKGGVSNKSGEVSLKIDADAATSKLKKVPSETESPNRQRLASESGQQKRVAYNVQMDDEKVQKKVAKKLAKQQVPQRSLIQKKVNLFSHLHQYEKDIKLTKDISFSSGSIHPIILKLGLQYAEGIISGSNARCIGLLCAFKKVISDYSTPPCKELSRDLESRIKPYISFLQQCRRPSVSMGNAIKFVKQQISQSPPDLAENEAKDVLLLSIDNFIRERIILAGEAISKTAVSKINNGDTIMIYGFSSLIIRILTDAHDNNKKFNVVVVDAHPQFEGRECVNRLSSYGIKCSYILTNAVSYYMKEVSRVFLGAHALLANGYVMSRTGSSVVAMIAKASNVPVLVCCETYKFCERVQTDAFILNELGDPDSLVNFQSSKPGILAEWRDKKSLYLLNLMYDVTPANFVDMVVTELAMIPCTSVPVVLRVKNTET